MAVEREENPFDFQSVENSTPSFYRGDDPGGDVIPLDVNVEERLAGESDEQHRTRLEKKQERLEMKRLYEEQLQANRELRERLESMEQGTRQFQQQLMQPRNQVDELEVHLQNLDAAEERHIKLAQAEQVLAQQRGEAVPLETQRQWEAQQRVINRRRTELLMQKTLRDSGIQPGHQVRRDVVHAQYADVGANPNAQAYAVGKWHMLRAMGHPDNEETLDLAMEEARDKFGMSKRKPKPVTSGDRARLAGVTGAKGPSEGETASVHMTPQLKELAHARYARMTDLTPRQKELLWVRKHGKQFLQRVSDYESKQKRA
jgi:hypothetical protein